MLTVTPTDPYILVSKVNCPPKCQAGIWGHHGGAHLKMTPTEDGMVNIGPVPERLHNGVYDLVIRDREGMCCHFMKVSVRMHEPPAMPITHTPTDPTAGETIIENCPVVESDGSVHIEESY